MDEKTIDGPRTLKKVPSDSNRFARKYTEGDVAWLETLGLTDLNVRMTLDVAYRQLDPVVRGRHGFGGTTERYNRGPENHLRKLISEAEADLKENPKDYSSRAKRMQAHYGLALHAKHKHEAPPAE